MFPGIVLKPVSLHLFQPWVKDFLYFLKSKCGQIPAALEKKLFLLTTNVTGDAERKERAGEEKAMRCCKYSRHDPAVMLPYPFSLS